MLRLQAGSIPDGGELPMDPTLISPLDALVLGIVEGLSEFLPISSTGHLILTTAALGLDGGDAGVKAFNVVIQAGALLAVIGYYFGQVRAMMLGLLGRDRDGLRLLLQLLAAFLPAAVVGLLADDWIKAHLFGPWPVVAALAVGGVAMIGVERWRLKRPGGAALDLGAMTWRAAVIIGCAQCLAMWPGTSRSMTTIVAALLLGFTPRAAAEFSFLLALPTLGAATAYDFLKEGSAILHVSGWLGLAIGFGVSMIVAWIAVKSFLAWLKQHGLIPFGYYRIAVAAVFAAMSLTGLIRFEPGAPVEPVAVQPSLAEPPAPPTGVLAEAAERAVRSALDAATSGPLNRIDARGETILRGGQPVAVTTPTLSAAPLPPLAEALAALGQPLAPRELALFTGNESNPGNPMAPVTRLIVDVRVGALIPRLRELAPDAQAELLIQTLDADLAALRAAQEPGAPAGALEGARHGARAVALLGAVLGNEAVWPRLRTAFQSPDSAAHFPPPIQAQVVALMALEAPASADLGFDREAVRQLIPERAVVMRGVGRISSSQASGYRLVQLREQALAGAVLSAAGLASESESSPHE